MGRHFLAGPGGAHGIADFLQAAREVLQLFLQFPYVPVLAGHDLVELLVQVFLECHLAFQFLDPAYCVVRGGQASSSPSAEGASSGGSQSSTRLPSGSSNQPKRP